MLKTIKSTIEDEEESVNIGYRPEERNRRKHWGSKAGNSNYNQQSETGESSIGDGTGSYQF